MKKSSYSSRVEVFVIELTVNNVKYVYHGVVVWLRPK